MTLSDEAAKLGAALAKIATSCGTTIYAVLTLQRIALLVAIAFNALQIFYLVRDKRRQRQHGGRK